MEKYWIWRVWAFGHSKPKGSYQRVPRTVLGIKTSFFDIYLHFVQTESRENQLGCFYKKSNFGDFARILPLWNCSLWAILVQKVQKIQSHFRDDSAHCHALFWYILVKFGNLSDFWHPKVPWYPRKQHMLLSQPLHSSYGKMLNFAILSMWAFKS